MHTDRLEQRFGAIGAVKMIAEAGFDAIEYSMYTKNLSVFSRGGRILAAELRRIAEGHGLSINIAHAPFSDFSPLPEDCEKNRAVYNSICESIHIAARLGVKGIVIHPAYICPRLSADERFEMNMELYSRFEKVARDLGIGIFIENVYRWHSPTVDKIVRSVCSDADELIRYSDALSSDIFSICFDVGHAALVGESAASMIRALGGRIGHIHIHDNDLESDLHTLPYLGNGDFSAIARAISKIGYSGDITLEADGFLRNMPNALVPSALLFMRSVASHIRDEIIGFSAKLY